jgi:L-serine/L-threonine ammonia-lyase
MTTALHNKTPLFYAHELSNQLNKKIYFKMDCHQPTGSFKIRGVGKRCQEAVEQGYEHLVIASGGNAGLATAYAGWKMGIKTTVVVPTTTKEFMRAKIAALGATVKVFGEAWNDANVFAQSLVKKEKAIYIPPFDHPTIWAGNASVIDECDTQMAPPDLVIVAVGGGGYFCGVMEGVLRNKWKNTTVITAETDGAASMKKALEQQELVTLDKIDSIASSLGAKRVAKQAFEYAVNEEVIAYSVSDKQALDACRLFLDETGNLVEPACGAALSAVYHNLEVIQNANSILVLVCGGSGLSLEQFNTYLKEYS